MNPKVINSMNARLARLEALLENSDVFKASGGTTYGGLQYEGSQYNFGSTEQDGTEQELAQNYGFGPSEMAIFEMQQRIAELELLVSSGSRDTNQGGALDAGAAVGDDGESGAGTVGSTPQTASEISAELGLGTMATQDADSVIISGGFALGMTTVSVKTSVGSSTAVNLGAGSDGGLITMFDDLGGNQVTISITSGGSLSIDASQGIIIGPSTGGLALGFYGSAGVAKPTVSGSRAGNAALASLLTALANQNLITNSTSA